jgi:hypothetical protein
VGSVALGVAHSDRSEDGPVSGGSSELFVAINDLSPHFCAPVTLKESIFPRPGVLLHSIAVTFANGCFLSKLTLHIDILEALAENAPPAMLNKSLKFRLATIRCQRGLFISRFMETDHFERVSTTFDHRR